MLISKQFQNYFREVRLIYWKWLTGSIISFSVGLLDKFVLKGQISPWLFFAFSIGGLIYVLTDHGFLQYKKSIPKLQFTDKCFPQDWKNQDGQGVEWYVEICNDSSISVYDILVELTGAHPSRFGSIKIPLHVQNHPDNPTTKFILHPGGRQRIGLVRSILGLNAIVILHTAGSTYLDPGKPGSKCRLVVTASGRDVPPAKSVFTVWLDEKYNLFCTPELVNPRTTK
jgi:hypothetical protein